MWKRLLRKRSNEKTKKQRAKASLSRHLSWGSSTASGEEHGLDRCKHRSSSVESLLSLERSLLKCDDNNNVRLVPSAYLSSEIEGTELKARDDTLGLDLSNDSFSEVEVEETIGKDGGVDDSESRTITFENPSRTNYVRCIIERGDSIGNACSRVSRNNVRFGSVEVYEHNVTLGGSIPLRGPPLSLGWERLSYHKHSSVEDHREDSSVYRRSLPQLIQSPEERTDILIKSGFTLREIRESARECGVVRTQRLRSARYSSRSFVFRSCRK